MLLSSIDSAGHVGAMAGDGARFAGGDWWLASAGLGDASLFSRMDMIRLLVLLVVSNRLNIAGLVSSEPPRWPVARGVITRDIGV